jgi:NIMA (never in mitosis gene a)-related kinase
MSEKEKEQLVAEVNILRVVRPRQLLSFVVVHAPPKKSTHSTHKTQPHTHTTNQTKLDHKHVVRYYDRIIDKDNKKIYIVMEYCSKGDLASLIKQNLKQGKHFDEVFIWRMFAQVCTALKACHDKTGGAVMHRDLKPGNIFLNSGDNVKLGDFGLARVLKNSMDYAKTHVGTPYYMSPEQVTQARYNQKSDIWSLGCLIYELAALGPPFRATNHLQLAMKIRQGRYPRIPLRYSQTLEDTLRAMIRVDPKKRPNIKKLLALPHMQAAIQGTLSPQAFLNNNKAAQEKKTSSSSSSSALLLQAQKLMRQAQEAQRAVARREQAVRERELKVEQSLRALRLRAPDLELGLPKLTMQQAVQHRHSSRHPHHHHSSNTTSSSSSSSSSTTTAAKHHSNVMLPPDSTGGASAAATTKSSFASIKNRLPMRLRRRGSAPTILDYNDKLASGILLGKENHHTSLKI